MKNFFTSMFGSLVALWIFLAGIVLLAAIAFTAATALGPKTAEVESGSYLVFDLSTNITDAPVPEDFMELAGDREQTLQLRRVTRALRAAAAD
ncbi:MAG: signal peptide peptidase SppA, partial [Opitutaceae bacterium]